MARRRRRLLFHPVVTALGPLVIVGGIALLVLLLKDPTPPAPRCMTLAEARGLRSLPFPPCTIVDRDHTYTATFETSFGNMTAELDPVISPRATNIFVFLAKIGFYDDTIIHKVFNDPGIKMIVGGDPTGTGRGTGGFVTSVDPPSPVLRYVPGLLGLWTPSDARTVGGQFFIIGGDSPELLPPKLPAFGRIVAESAPTVLRILEVDGFTQPDGSVKPEPTIRLRKVRIQERVRGRR